MNDLEEEVFAAWELDLIDDPQFAINILKLEGKIPK